MSQSTLTSPFQALVPIRLSRRYRVRDDARTSTSSPRQAAVAQMLTPTSAHRAFDRDLTVAQSRILLALR